MARTTSSLLVKDLNATQGSNLNTTITMMSTYAIKVKSDETMQIASDMISNGRLSPEDLRSLISVGYEDNGTIMYIYAVYTDPENAARIAEKALRAAVLYNNRSILIRCLLFKRCMAVSISAWSA